MVDVEKYLQSGGISGAIADVYSKRAMRHATKYYGAIRKSKTDVENIAKNTGFAVDQILMVKHYLFIDEHILEGGTKRFEPCFQIAESWRRLAFDPQNIKPHDITLLRHEIAEMELVAKGMSQNDAHTQVSKTYDYRKESDDYYNALEMKNPAQKDNKKLHTSGALTYEESVWEERY